MKLKDEKTVDLILEIYAHGIICANNEKTSKAREKRIQSIFMELERRGVIEDGAGAYERTTR